MYIISYCENPKHEGRTIELRHYKDILLGKLLICPECYQLYYYNEGGFLIPLREESFLISNIDSPINNSLWCKCGSLTFRASDYTNPDTKLAWYYCPKCKKMSYISTENSKPKLTVNFEVIL